MEPRLVIKTHEKVTRLGYFSVLLARCLTPADGLTSRLAEKRLAEALEPVDPKFVLPAKFAVLMAQRFQFLSARVRTQWRGSAVAAAQSLLARKGDDPVSDFLVLKPLERVLYCKYLVEADGAVLLRIATLMEEMNGIPLTYLREHIHEVFRGIVGEYKDGALLPRDRLALDAMLRRMQKGKYDQKEVDHKIRPHLGFLQDLGLAASQGSGEAEVYVPTVIDGRRSSAALVSELGDIGRMERRLEAHEGFDLAASVLGLQSVAPPTVTGEERLEEMLLDGYSRMKDDLTGMVNVDGLYDLTAARSLTELGWRVTSQDVESALMHFQLAHPGRLAFQVGYSGRDTYVVIR